MTNKDEPTGDVADAEGLDATQEEWRITNGLADALQQMGMAISAEELASFLHTKDGKSLRIRAGFDMSVKGVFTGSWTVEGRGYSRDEVLEELDRLSYEMRDRVQKMNALDETTSP